MSWTDEELDKLFSDSVGDMTFEYKKEYFKDIEKHLPISKKRDVLWTGMSLLMGSIVIYLMIQPTGAVWEGEMSSKQTLAEVSHTEYQESVISSRKTENGVSFNKNETFSVSRVGLVNNDKPGVSKTPINVKSYSAETKSMQKVIDTHVTAKMDQVEFSEVREEQLNLNNLSLDLLEETAISQELINASPQIDRIDRTSGFDFFIQGIAGVGQGKMLPGEKMSKSTGLGLGIELNKRRLTASIALNGMVSHHDGMELSRISKVYGFGSKEYKSTIEYSKLFKAESELTVGYRMGRFTAFSGVNVNYLVTTESTLSSFENEQLNTTDVRRLYGYKTGLKNWGLKPMIGMNFEFKNRIQFGANLGMQVVETVEPEFLEGTSRPLPLEGRLYLRLKL
jgi:hypothetical protein